MIPKFRGKSTAEENKGEWVYGNLVFDKDLAIIVNGIDEATCEYIAFEDFCSVDIDTVGQSTGLSDKNGVEIFEKDVVRLLDSLYTIFYDSEKGSYGLKPHDDRWVVDYMSNFSHGRNFEVVGNIYESEDNA